MHYIHQLPTDADEKGIHYIGELMADAIAFRQVVLRKLSHNTAVVAGIDANTTLTRSFPGVTGGKTAMPLTLHRPDMMNVVAA